MRFREFLSEGRRDREIKRIFRDLFLKGEGNWRVRVFSDFLPKKRGSEGSEFPMNFLLKGGSYWRVKRETKNGRISGCTLWGEMLRERGEERAGRLGGGSSERRMVNGWLCP